MIWAGPEIEYLRRGEGGGIEDEGLGEGMEDGEDPASPPVVETDGLDGGPEVPSEDACSDD
jgi:hypothetical protein